jgi:hypothetical protein
VSLAPEYPADCAIRARGAWRRYVPAA